MAFTLLGRAPLHKSPARLCLSGLGCLLVAFFGDVLLGQTESSSGILFQDNEEESEEPLSSPEKPNKEKGSSQLLAQNSPKFVGPPTPGKSAKETSVYSGQKAGSQNAQNNKYMFKRAEEPDIFGEYRIRLGASKPEFSGELKYYDALYGKASYYPSFSADWYAFDWYATFGVSIRTGFYTDEGKAGRGRTSANENQSLPKEEINAENIGKDSQAPTTLTLLPLQLTAIVQFTPFERKWLVLDGWFGIERLYFQEVRAGSSPSSAMISSDASTDKTLTNNGFKNGLVYGFGANIRIDSIDEKTTLSLRPMGLDAVYLTPSYEVVQQTDKGVNFSRTVTSIAFVFESRH